MRQGSGPSQWVREREDAFLCQTHGGPLSLNVLLYRLSGAGDTRARAMPQVA